ncbi:MAG: hypothetical protein QG670_2526 [Thermoproteota archaeon]|nr:hypothetical protein [Thermoproteota archaeon]
MIGFFGFMGLIILGASLGALCDYVLFLSKSPIETIGVVIYYDSGTSEEGSSMRVQFIDATGNTIVTSPEPHPAMWTNVTVWNHAVGPHGGWGQRVDFPNGTTLFFPESGKERYQATYFVTILYNLQNPKDARPSGFYLQSAVAGTIIGAIWTSIIAYYTRKEFLKSVAFFLAILVIGLFLMIIIMSVL